MLLLGATAPSRPDHPIHQPLPPRTLLLSRGLPSFASALPKPSAVHGGKTPFSPKTPPPPPLLSHLVISNMAAATAASSSSDASDGPVLSLINKRLRALRKKYNRILQMEESLSHGKVLNKEQEESLRAKPYIISAIDELEKLKQPLSAAVSEEINAAIQTHRQNSPTTANSSTTVEKPTSNDNDNSDNNDSVGEGGELKERAERGEFVVVEDLLNLMYFGSMFDVKNQNDYTATMLTRTHERGCCLTYDYVTDDDAADLLLGERDLDLISMLGGLLISRPVNSSLSHKNALQRCIEHANLWLAKSDQLIDPASNVTYSGLREKLNKIMASDYFITTPEMKAPVEVAAAAGSYASFQVPMHGSTVPVDVPVVMPVQVEGSVVQYQQKEEEETANAEENESYDNQLSPVEEFDQGDENENFSELPAQNEPVMHQAEIGQNLQEFDPREQNYVPRRSYQGYRGGRGVGASGRRGFPNGRGGRGNGRGGSYQNGRNQYFDQAGNYHPRNNYYRGRGGRGFGGNYNYQAGYVVADS